MSHSRRLSLEPAIDSITGRVRDSLNLQTRHNDDVINKPDFRQLDLAGSPVSPLMPRVSSSSSSSAAATPTSSSGSSGSASGKPSSSSQIGKTHSGEISISGSGMPTNRNLKPGHRRSSSTGTPLIFSGSSFYSATTGTNGANTATSAVSPSPSVLPAGNICPSGRILKTGMATRVSNRTETLCTGTGNYGHGNVVRSGGGGGGSNGKTASHAAANGENSPEELKRLGNEMYRRGNFSEALSLYDRAISLSPGNAAYRSNRAAALTALGRLGDAVKECLEAVKLDTSYLRAHQRLASLYLRYISCVFKV